jgi:hypothetical protein
MFYCNDSSSWPFFLTTYNGVQPPLNKGDRVGLLVQKRRSSHTLPKTCLFLFPFPPPVSPHFLSFPLNSRPHPLAPSFPHCAITSATALLPVSDCALLPLPRPTAVVRACPVQAVGICQRQARPQMANPFQRHSAAGERTSCLSMPTIQNC